MLSPNLNAIFKMQKSYAHKDLKKDTSRKKLNKRIEDFEAQ